MGSQLGCQGDASQDGKDDAAAAQCEVKEGKSPGGPGQGSYEAGMTDSHVGSKLAAQCKDDGSQ